MWFMRIMHMQTNLLNRIGDVRTGEHKVLKGTCQAATVCWISNLSAYSSRELWAQVNWSSTRLAVLHTCSTQDVKHILTLRSNPPEVR
jgi:hypothetical protein